nr:immunoglobulin heavy chain junction region [Macaca mulatta]MOV38730.1 immunoglobulin heavy chain junction region [Macaca mulatta]MOV39461.1 immunoglobulin heavy chain junction region [Macaca mulatta]MOV39542.1 immunoglobulin heavy chain junction region [Macaca mulatta]MOV40045.1 immunoglobulin heavy chain junction region [Macaca mulatta]
CARDLTTTISAVDIKVGGSDALDFW